MNKLGRCSAACGCVLSLCIVALGQPARLGLLGLLAAALGFALFWRSIPASLSPARRFWLGTLWFAAVQLVQLSWMTSIEFQGYYILGVYACLALAMGSQFGLITWMLPARGKMGWRTLLSCSALWTCMEWIRLFFFCGFSWNPIGLALTDSLYALQFANLFGVFGLSFWVMLTNLTALNALRKHWNTLWVFVAIAAVPYLYGALHLKLHHPPQQGKTIEVALVQTSLLPSEKLPQEGRLHEFVPPLQQWRRMLRALHEMGPGRLDILVLPEAVVPMHSDQMLYLFEEVKEVLIAELGPEVEKSFPSFTSPYARERILRGKRELCVSNLFWCQTLANHFQTEVVAGLDHMEGQAGTSYNSAFYLYPGQEKIERYDKQVLLPLAEYLPLQIFKSLSARYGILGFFTPGQGAKVLGEAIKSSPSICYEETLPGPMRAGRAQGADLFVNVTNDNYFPHSTLHRQHLFHARLRAVENGIPLIRASNAAASALIDSFGQIVEAKKTEPGQCDVLKCALDVHSHSTLYTFWGEFALIGACLIILFLSKKFLHTLFLA